MRVYVYMCFPSKHLYEAKYTVNCDGKHTGAWESSKNTSTSKYVKQYLEKCFTMALLAENTLP